MNRQNKSKEHRLPKWVKTLQFQLILSSLILFVIVRLSYQWSQFELPYDYQEGDVLKADLVLNQDYYDKKATEALKEQVKYNVEEAYTIDASVYGDAKKIIEDFYIKGNEVRAEYPDEEDFRISMFKYVLRDFYDLTEEELSYLANVDEYEFRLSQSYLYDVLKNVLSSGVSEENVIEAKNSIDAYFKSVDQLPNEMNAIVSKIAKSHVKVNRYVDEQATQKRIEENVKKIDDVIIYSGTLIGKKGDVITTDALNIINDLNLNNLHTFKQDLPLYLKDAGVIILLSLMTIIMQYHYKKKSRNIDFKEIYLNYTILILMYLMTYIFGTISIYLIPIAATGMLISILDDEYTGILFSVYLTILYGYVHNTPLEILVFTIIASMIASIMVYRVYQRGRIFIAGMSVSVLYVLTVFGTMTVAQSSFKEMVEPLLFAMASGVICSMVTIGSLPLWELVFKILTPLKLLEFANPNHPLMKQLLLEAPGTYHHSVLVANLSESACHDIDANGLLARVGAYFHDIGKIEKPYMYVENQYDGHNPHDALLPQVSANIIKKHAKKGVALGKQYKLPKEILMFAEQHHGTTLIKYFYHKAKEAGEEVDEIDFKYDGPIPQTKEIAVVMLADSVEAAVRSMKQPDRKGIHDLIQKIVQNKMRDHQLDESGLTLQEIDIITNVFINSLSSAFHERIEYPDMEEASHHLTSVK
ncbi:MAG: HDIG domain-containing protein [Clostridia bacterium]|nr:HDIG domain-containing protein [Clostridia bacterium]